MTVPIYRWQASTSQVAAAAGISATDVIRFDQNTSPYVPEWVREVSERTMPYLNEYPAADYMPLRQSIADYEGVTPEQVVPGAGADELILLCAKAFLGPGLIAVGDDPGYQLFRIASVQAGARFRAVERCEDLSYPSAAGDAAAHRAALAWMCVPHNPTGLRDPDVALPLGRAAITVVDAAYAEFSGDRRRNWLQGPGQTVVLGTLSKAFGLAGIRVGYAIADEDVAARLNAVRPPGSIGAVSATLAAEAMARADEMRQSVERIASERKHLTDGLQSLGTEPLPSTTNFVLTRVGPDAGGLAARLLNRGLVVRTFSGRLAEYLRFTVRRAEENDRLLETLQEELR